MTQPGIGIQLYTVREELQRDFRGVLRALADMGYAGVEFAWYYGGMAPDELAAFMRQTGLLTVGLYESPERLIDPAGDAYAYARALGCRYVTTGLEGRVKTDWPAAIRTAGEIGRVAKDMGFVFTYHNHDQEFERIDGSRALDLLYEQTDPDLVRCELDTYWILRGGEDPVEYLRRYAGRVPLVHLQDRDAHGAGPTAVGDGVLDVRGVCDTAGEIGVEWLVVEQHQCATDPLAQARKSVDFLHSERRVSP